MSLSSTADLAFNNVGLAFTYVYFKVSMAVPTAIDECLLDDATRPTAKSFADNLENFALGTGKWIALGLLIIGVIMLIFGNTRWIRIAAVGILGLVLLSALIAIGAGAIGSNNCGS